MADPNDEEDLAFLLSAIDDRVEQYYQYSRTAQQSTQESPPGGDPSNAVSTQANSGPTPGPGAQQQPQEPQAQPISQAGLGQGQVPGQARPLQGQQQAGPQQTSQGGRSAGPPHPSTSMQAQHAELQTKVRMQEEQMRMMHVNIAQVETERKGLVDRLQELGQQQRGLGAHSVQQLREQLTEATQQLRFKEQEAEDTQRRAADLGERLQSLQAANAELQKQARKGDEERAQMVAELAAAARVSEDRMAAGPTASQPNSVRPSSSGAQQGSKRGFAAAMGSNPPAGQPPPSKRSSGGSRAELKGPVAANGPPIRQSTGSMAPHGRTAGQVEVGDAVPAAPPGMQPSSALARAEPTHGDVLCCLWTNCPTHLSTLLSLQAAGPAMADEPLAAAEGKLGMGIRHVLQSLGCQAPSAPTQLLQSLLTFLSAAHSCGPSHWAIPTPPYSTLGSRVHPSQFPQKPHQQPDPAARPSSHRLVSHPRLLLQPAPGGLKPGKAGRVQPGKKGAAHNRGKKGGDDWSQADLRPSLKAVLRMLEVLLTDATACRAALWQFAQKAEDESDSAQAGATGQKHPCSLEGRLLKRVQIQPEGAQPGAAVAVLQAPHPIALPVRSEGPLGDKLTAALLDLALEASNCNYSELVTRLLPALGALASTCSDNASPKTLAGLFTTGTLEKAGATAEGLQGRAAWLQLLQQLLQVPHLQDVLLAGIAPWKSEGPNGVTESSGSHGSGSHPAAAGKAPSSSGVPGPGASKDDDEAGTAGGKGQGTSRWSLSRTCLETVEVGIYLDPPPSRRAESSFPGSRAGGVTVHKGCLGQASLGSGHGHSWQMRLVVVQETLALLRALLIHSTLGAEAMASLGGSMAGIQEVLTTSGRLMHWPQPKPAQLQAYPPLPIAGWADALGSSSQTRMTTANAGAVVQLAKGLRRRLLLYLNS
ncbi:hypothetical protein WJX74_006753 [Apatococcus lobatus]|uniref:Uncharacterized protein n=1 Tax=Apatococcus lobatus TaxID=904363 RepID=A0AAW1RNS3_9CHLO